MAFNKCTRLKNDGLAVNSSRCEHDILQWPAWNPMPEKKSIVSFLTVKYTCVFYGWPVQVFDQVKALLVSCVDGYNVCIFAYGQTGSGKTFTMEVGRRVVF